MLYSVKAIFDGDTVLATAGTAKAAFAKAVEWQVAKRLRDVTISDGRSDYSIAEFSAKMALAEITVTERSFDSF
jgi:hypothetical protein